ncbi:uncharacterized protein LOC116043324 isoform X2 [Sander lucioperca]|uniref:uncharacterized protein LOC116043324 isoform X2 n=1 Tax=Sander lucioperca TaxID=283035 RepID=UPI00125DE315|nr:uncharacterized protein LOC116043324 isoform X2 [Sander lucioperca]
MAAPSTDRPVTITVGAILRLQVKPPLARPPRLSVAVTVQWVVITLARVIFGLALMTLLMIPYVTLPCERDAAQPQEHPKGFKACLPCLINLFFCTWILAGDVWVFSVYQPNYDPAAADGAYCDKTLYTFAFWNAVWETFVILVLLARLCKGLLCCVMMSPATTNRDFYGNV